NTHSTAPKTATVAGDGTWEVSGIDVTTLNDGTITYNVTETDSGKTATGSKTTTKSTAAKTGAVTTTTDTSDHKTNSTYVQTVVFTGNVRATGTPSGKVQFEVDGVSMGSPVTLSGGVATFSTSTLSAGTHTIRAIYTSDDGSLFRNSIGTASQSVLK